MFIQQDANDVRDRPDDVDSAIICYMVWRGLRRQMINHTGTYPAHLHVLVPVIIPQHSTVDDTSPGLIGALIQNSSVPRLWWGSLSPLTPCSFFHRPRLPWRPQFQKDECDGYHQMGHERGRVQTSPAYGLTSPILFNGRRSKSHIEKSHL